MKFNFEHDKVEFKCDECGKIFKSERGLKVHTKCHEKIGQVDGNTTLSTDIFEEGDLNGGSKSIDENETSMTKEEQIKDLINPPDLMEHVINLEELYPGERTRFGCNKCDMWSYHIGNVNNHMQYSHWMPENGFEEH